MKPPIYILTA